MHFYRRTPKPEVNNQYGRMLLCVCVCVCVCVHLILRNHWRVDRRMPGNHDALQMLPHLHAIDYNSTRYISVAITRSFTFRGWSGARMHVLGMCE
jgi:hypothetical protein